MKILILYFSGTGNTYYIAKTIKERLQCIIDVNLASIEEISWNNIPQHDILFFGFPVYETDSPCLVQEYIKQIPKISNKGLFLFCTHAGVPGNVLGRNFKRFIAKGYIPLGHLKIRMMDTGAITFMKKDSFIVKYIQKRDYTKIKVLNRFINETIEKILNIKSINDFKNYKISIPYSLSGFLFDWLWRLTYKILGGFLKKRFWVDGKCNLCKLCIKICPVKNIVIENNKVIFGNNCFLCFRCINQCPTESIQIGKKTVGKFRWKGPNGCFNPSKFYNV